VVEELRLQQSLAEYVKAWVNLHGLRRGDLGSGSPALHGAFLSACQSATTEAFDRSVKAFLDGHARRASGIDAVSEWLASSSVAPRARARAQPHLGLHHAVDVSRLPGRRDEKFCEHLSPKVAPTYREMNPTLARLQNVCGILNDALGYKTFARTASRSTRSAVGSALGLIRRLKSLANARGPTSAPSSATPGGREHRTVLSPGGKAEYLSGSRLT